MSRNIPPQLAIWVLLAVLFCSGCGPDTIFVRPSLDTPLQHVKNGQCLLERGKIDAAFVEFTRARMLNDRYAPAYVGLALVQGERGNRAAGLELLKQATPLAANPAEMKEIEDGIDRLQKLQSGSAD